MESPPKTTRERKAERRGRAAARPYKYAERIAPLEAQEMPSREGKSGGTA